MGMDWEQVWGFSLPIGPLACQSRLSANHSPTCSQPGPGSPWGGGATGAVPGSARSGSRWFLRAPDRRFPLPVPPLMKFGGPRCPPGTFGRSQFPPFRLRRRLSSLVSAAVNHAGSQSRQGGGGVTALPQEALLLPIFGFNSRFLCLILNFCV